MYRLDDSLNEFCKEVGGNPYSHDEYEVCVGVKECCEKKDWEALKGWYRKALFGFIEIEIVKAFKKWVLAQPVAAEVIVTADEPESEQKQLDDLLC